MVSTHRTKESLRAYRKVVVQNWNLFKASRVGVIGLAVMIAFLAMALAAPFMGLRDPVKWLAPAQDILNVSAYWVPPLDDVPGSFFGETGPVNTSLAFRITASADNTRVDRIYLAWGERLYAFKSWRPTQAWDSAGTSKVYIDLRPLAGGGGGNVSTNPVVVNYGDFVGSFSSGNEKYPEYFVYVGMSDGRVLAFRDTYRVSFMRNPDDENARGVTPKATLVWSTRVNGSVTGLAAFSADKAHGRTGTDRLAVSTSTGWVHVYSVGNGTPGVTGDDGGGVHGDPAPHFEMGNWSSPAGQPLLLADAPMRGQGAFPMRSPAFSSNATNLVVGGTEGKAHMLQFYRFPPLLRHEWTITAAPPERTPWTSPPTIAYTSGTAPHYGQDIVYVPGAEGWLFPRYLDNRSIAGWDGQEFDRWPVWAERQGGGVRLEHRNGTADPGDLAQPTAYGEIIYVGSTSGCLYAVRLVGVAASLSSGSAATAINGSTFWRFCEQLRDQGFDPRFTSAPVVNEAKGIVLVGAAIKDSPGAAVYRNGVMYSLLSQGDGQGRGKIQYQIDLENRSIWKHPISYWDPDNLNTGVWFVGTGETRATVYGYDVAGSVLLPSEPTWAHLYSCPENGVGAKCPGYRSGNMYWLGLDSRGRDIFSQLIWGSRIALLVGFLSAFFTVLIGLMIGLLAGYLGGRIDSILMRFTDVILVLPGLPLIIIMASVLGSSIWNIILVISLVGWPGVARVIRAEVLSLKERPFIESARVTGASPTRIMFRHIAPNVMPLAFLFMTFGVSGAILSEAALSFIGLGDVNTMSWGIMLYYVQNSNALKAWWWLLPPGIAITMISLSFFLVGRAFDEIVNPRLRKR